MNYIIASCEYLIFVGQTLLTAVLSLFALYVYGSPQDEHRFDCTTVACGKIKAYSKRHYCGKAQVGNGPDDSCDIESARKIQNGVEVEADYRCEWNETKQDAVCKEIGHPSLSVRRILHDELRKLGLPDIAPGKIRFNVMKSLTSGWLVAGADYSYKSGADLDLCEVIALIDKDSQVTVLRKSLFQKTDIDVPNVTEWSVLDIADVEGTGQMEIVLEGDAYEDHWLEVIRLHAGSPLTVFSGLGYYL
ncbi:MAG TPA: hypothetical protein VK709_17830 [Candidatus Saccharimonadales bacterium]|nr:hypothetical protein [Candidatus Saccharimonadales bacterium]